MTSYGDWQHPFTLHFGLDLAHMRVVELGKGEGTLWLYGRCASLVSLEYSRYPFTASWESAGLEGHICVNLPTPPNLLDLDNVLVRSRGKERPTALADEARKIHAAARAFGGDLLFIDHGSHNRGEVLAAAFAAGWSCIAVHDSNFPYYGYARSSPWYDATEYNEGQGTIIFDRKDSVVTFVIPSTGRSTLERTLASVRNQTNPLWSVLVGFDAVDDAVVDGLTLPDDNRIRYVRLAEKAGGGRNFGGGVRNHLISRFASGWIGFVDDDDSLRPDYVDRLVEVSTANPDAAVIVFRMSYDPDDTHVLPPLGMNCPVKNKVGISFAVRKEVLDRHGLGFVNGATEDYALLSAIEATGERIVFAPHITYNVRF